MLIWLLVLVGGIAGSPAWASIHGDANLRPIAAFVPQEGGAAISGTVADASNTPLPGANRGDGRNGAAQTATSDAKGKYEIASLAAGTYAISVSAKGYRISKWKLSFKGRSTVILL